MDGDTRAGSAQQDGDSVLAEATELALDAAVEDAGAAAFVGEPLGIAARTTGSSCTVSPAGCRPIAAGNGLWCCPARRARRSSRSTRWRCCPAMGAMLAPGWVPWSDRIQAGDLGVGDLLPTAADDPRLALRLTDVDELSDDLPFFELGLGRARVLSLEGRELAATRWYESDPGPSAAISRSAPAQCGTCGFYIRLVGGLGRLFGVCGNEFAPDDASVVAGRSWLRGALRGPRAPVRPPASRCPSMTTRSRRSSLKPVVVHDPGAVDRAEAVAGTRRGALQATPEPDYSPTLRPSRRSRAARRRQ